jgi:outer membrane protein assembly factor BamA
MSRNLGQSITRTLGLALLAICGTSITVQSQAQEKPRPVLEFTGNQIFSSSELQAEAKRCIDPYSNEKFSQVLDYCVHRLDFFVKSRGYLQATLTMPNADQIENQSTLVITVKEGPLYRVGEVKIAEARLFSPEQIRDELGLKTGDIANGEELSTGLYERVKTRYAKFGYIQYTADVQPKFRAKEGDSEGVVDFIITIDEGQQFKVRHIKILGADRASTDLLKHELLVRDGDILDDELFRDSIKRLNSTGLVEPVDADKDVDFHQMDQQSPFMDLTIHVKKSAALAATVH